MTTLINPLLWKDRIVDKDGLPTVAFLRAWAQTVRANSTLAAGAIVGDSNPDHFLDGNLAFNPVSDAKLVLTPGSTTGDVSSTTHGFVPILPNDNTKFLNGQGAFTAPPTGGGGAASLPPYRFINVHAGTSVSAGACAVVPTVFTAAASILEIDVVATAASATAVLTPCAYADSSGAPGALVGSGSAVTGVTVGMNVLPFTSALAITKGTVLWVGFLLTVAAIPTAQAPWSMPGAYRTGLSALPNPFGSPTYAAATNFSWWAN